MFGTFWYDRAARRNEYLVTVLQPTLFFSVDCKYGGGFPILQICGIYKEHAVKAMQSKHRRLSDMGR